MICRQFLHAAPIGASYLFGCGGHAQCVVVDPVGDVAPYQQVSLDTGMRIVHVIDTLATSAEAGAHALFESASRLRALPDYLEVWPGAFAGSVCGRRLSGKPASTLGFERRFNRAFATTDRNAFVRLMLEDIPTRPDHADDVRAANKAIRRAPSERRAV
jgi:hypothetical protein